MPTAHELQRNFALRQALHDAEMKYQCDMDAARAAYGDGTDPALYPQFAASVQAADRARSRRVEAAYQAEREAAATEFAPQAKPQLAAARSRG
jgi:hypothetical protein